MRLEMTSLGQSSDIKVSAKHRVGFALSVPDEFNSGWRQPSEASPVECGKLISRVLVVSSQDHSSNDEA